MAACRRRAVVADGDRQEVEHEVRVVNLIIAPREAAALEVVRCARARPKEEPLGTDEGSPPELQIRVERDRLGAGVLYVDLEVVLKILADPGQVVDRFNPDRPQMIRIADPGELE